MSVTFFEGRRQRHYAGYGDAGSDIANIIRQASPWDFLKGTFVDKPAAEAAAQAQIAQAQSEQNIAEAGVRGETIRTLVMVGAGLGGLMLLALMLRRPRSSVAGYRRKSRRSRRARR